MDAIPKTVVCNGASTLAWELAYSRGVDFLSQRRVNVYLDKSPAILLFVRALVARLGRDEVRMNEIPSARLDREGVAALNHMEGALELLNGCEGAWDVGAHLDLAICRLRDLLEFNGIEVVPRPPEPT